MLSSYFVCYAPAPTEIYTLSLHDALPISFLWRALVRIDQLPVERAVHYAIMKVSEKQALSVRCPTCGARPGEKCELSTTGGDRKSTRLNSSHRTISYAVFCLKKKRSMNKE